MSKKPWMPLYVADYLADTAHLSAAESGAYLHLIFHYWLTGGLPTDDAALARIARVHPPHWKRTRSAIEPFFGNPKTGGLWVQKRIDQELSKIDKISNNRKAAMEQFHQRRRASAVQMHIHSHSHSDKNDDDGIARGRATVSDEQRIAEAMAAECGFPTPQDWPPGWCGAPMWVRKCLDDGWPEAVMLATAKAVARKKTGGAIEHYRYLEKPLATAVALSRAPLPKVEILPQEVVRAGYGKTSGLDRRLAEQRDAIDALDDLIERERGGGGQTNHGGDDAAECRGSESVRGGDGSTILALSAARRRDGG